MVLFDRIASPPDSISPDRFKQTVRANSCLEIVLPNQKT